MSKAARNPAVLRCGMGVVPGWLQSTHRRWRTVPMLKLLAALFHAALVFVVVPGSSLATERKTRTPEVQQLRDQLARAKQGLRKVDRGAARALKMGAKTNESVPPAPTV